jgi:D-glycero-D-manno-heptose 1,7-bisphosphate phosphatase
MAAAVFLDRDGVIIHNQEEYIRTWKDVAFYPGALESLGKASQSDFRFVIVTNQSAIGRGLMSMEQAEAINARLVREVQLAGGRIDGVFLCPHTPEDECGCRKPRPGLILAAAGQLKLDLGRSVLIGDALSDIEAGRAAGVGRSWIVRTGRGKAQLGLPEAARLLPIPTYDNLAMALDALLQSPNGAKQS